MTKLDPRVPEKLRGTYAGLGTRDVLDYIKSLGVTSVELLPVHAFVQDDYLQQKDLVNYWGYNTISFFTPRAATRRCRTSPSPSSRRWSRASTAPASR